MKRIIGILLALSVLANIYLFCTLVIGGLRSRRVQAAYESLRRREGRAWGIMQELLVDTATPDIEEAKKLIARQRADLEGPAELD
jgi:hypothetical protein